MDNFFLISAFQKNLEPPNRGLAAKKEYMLGQEILMEVPLSAVPLTSKLNVLCAYCFTPSSTKCSSCKKIQYCSVFCQSQDWPCHSLECKKDLPTFIRFIIRALHSRKLNLETWEQTLKLYSVDKKQHEDTINYVSKIVPESWIPPQKELKKFLQLVPINGTNIHTLAQGLQPVGQALYPVFSLINHSCEPNAYVTFSGRNLSLRCLRPIEKNQEILISYVDQSQPIFMRQKQLLFFDFQCRCLRCSFESNEETIELTTLQQKINQLHSMDIHWNTLMETNFVRKTIFKYFKMHPLWFLYTLNALHLSYKLIRKNKIILKDDFWPNTPKNLLEETKNWQKRAKMFFPMEQLKPLGLEEFEAEVLALNKFI